MAQVEAGGSSRDLRARDSGRFRNTGASILSGGSRPPSNFSEGKGSPLGNGPTKSAPGYDQPPSGAMTPILPPSARTGVMFSGSAPSLTPRIHVENVPRQRGIEVIRKPALPEPHPRAIWSDSCQHLGEDPWPMHSVPLFVFQPEDLPKIAYREEVQFKLTSEVYVTFALRLRCGIGDHYGGGSVGIVSSDGHEVLPGTPGQLIMVTSTEAHPDNSVVVEAVGDLPFIVKRSWCPRGTRGMQFAFVEVQPVSVRNLSIVEACQEDEHLSLFAKLVQAVPNFADAFATQRGPFTVFVPTNDVLQQHGLTEESLRHISSEQLETLLRCHTCLGKFPLESMYAGRTLKTLNSSVLMMGFARWPRLGPRVNDVPCESMDLMCVNGVIHVVEGLLGGASVPDRPSRNI